MRPLLILVGLLLAAEAAAQGAPSLDSVVSGLQATYQAKSDYRARFAQVVHRPQLSGGSDLKKSGKVYFKKPGRMRWDYEVPDKVYYVSDGMSLTSYVAEEAVAYVLDVRSSVLYASLSFLFGEGDLRRDFEVSAGTPWEAERCALRLKPRAGQANFREVSLTVNPATSEVVEALLVDPMGTESRITFSDVSYSPVPEAAFVFTAPSGVRVEDLRGKP